MFITFDFDETIIRSTPFHRAGWQQALVELQIQNDLNEILVYEPNLKERYDSYRRIREGFFRNSLLKSKVCAYFKSIDEDQLTKNLMNLKESMTVKKILETAASDLKVNMGENFIPFLDVLSSKKYKLGIVSSSREAIINSFLYKLGLINIFSYVIGEESLTDEIGVLHDKPDIYALNILKTKNFGLDVYIGDNDTIDRQFADVCNARYIYANYKNNYLDLIDKI